MHCSCVDVCGALAKPSQPTPLYGGYEQDEVACHTQRLAAAIIGYISAVIGLVQSRHPSKALQVSQPGPRFPIILARADGCSGAAMHLALVCVPRSLVQEHTDSLLRTGTSQRQPPDSHKSPQPGHYGSRAP